MIAGVTVVLYGSRLGPPPPLSAGETAVVAQARSLASTGRDTSGRPAPLFFQIADDAWLQPLAVYASAAWIAVGSDGDLASRFASVQVTAVSALLMYLVSLRVLRREWLAVSTAALLVLTPALFANGRVATDAPYALPFVLLWLYSVLAFVDRPRTWLLAAAGCSLGAGVYSQPAAPITMLCLCGLTIPVLRVAGHRRLRPAVAVAAGFALPLLAMLAWFAGHPDSYHDTMGRWAILKAHIRFPIDGLRAFVNWTTLGMRVSLYWGFFDPSWLFFTGPDRSGALRGAAPLLLSLGALAPVGISHAVRTAARATTLLLVGGLAIAPMAASTLGEAHNIGQALTILPFAVLSAGLGVESLLGSTSGTARRTAGLALLALVPVQFAFFYWGHLAR